MSINFLSIIMLTGKDLLLNDGKTSKKDINNPLK